MSCAEITPEIKKQVSELVIRSQIDYVESILEEVHASGVPQQECKLTHSFTDGIYVREIFIPADTFVTGRIHRHNHLNYITKGKVTVLTRDGRETLEGPCTIYSTAGTKRALYTHTDTIWTTVHANPTNETDIDKLEDIMLTPDYTPFPLLEGNLQELIGELICQQ